MSEQFAAAYRFMLQSARLVDMRAFEARFLGNPSYLVDEAVRAYRNADGGLGHALEPDSRCPTSQPLFCELGLSILCEVGHRDRELGQSICAYLDTVADERGLLPPYTAEALAYPHAAHWDVPVVYGLNPTAGLCGLLHYHGAEHEWLSRATRTCCAMLLDQPPAEAHLLLGATRLADHLPDRDMAGRLREMIGAVLPTASFFIPSAPVQGYGLTPLHFAPTPQSSWRSLFSEAQIAGHLDDLLARQQADGGWPISWNPPAGASALEWRGRWTYEAVTPLVAYGRLTT
jgi:hypothetical protein